MKTKPFAVNSLAAAVLLAWGGAVHAATPGPTYRSEPGCPWTGNKPGVYAPCLGLLPPGASSASQAVGVHHLHDKTGVLLPASISSASGILPKFNKQTAPNGAFGAITRISLLGGAGQQNPTSSPPSCPYGYASGPTWSGWDATGWQYTCNPPPPPPPPAPAYTPPAYTPPASAPGGGGGSPAPTTPASTPNTACTGQNCNGNPPPPPPAQQPPALYSAYMTDSGGGHYYCTDTSPQAAANDVMNLFNGFAGVNGLLPGPITIQSGPFANQPPGGCASDGLGGGS